VFVGLIYAAAIVWLVSPTWRPPSSKPSPAGIERRAAAAPRIAIKPIGPAKALTVRLPAQPVGADATTGSTVPSASSGGGSSQSGSSGGSTSTPSTGTPSTTTPTETPTKRVISVEE
jgi:hypothetical protein